MRPAVNILACLVTTLALPTLAFAGGESHWAFRPVRKPVPPAVADPGWVRSPIDAFVLAKLEANGLSPSPPADRRTLIRRVTFDLIGLPPTYEEVRAFEQDDSPDAFAKVVDRLLASPQYGERWGRHWLDVARYADTKDLVLLFGNDRIRPYAYTYRDYVIRSFNEDTPYDDFIREQIAADKLDPAQKWKLAGMGFLTVGRLFDNNPPDIYDDQIDTVTRGFLGLTVSCARCHDHKYDPIPTADYYSLYGVFAASERPLERPLIADPDEIPGAAEFEKQAGAKRKELRDLIEAQYREITEAARQRVGDYLVKIATEPPDPLETAVFFLSLSPDDLRPQILARWRRYLEKHAGPDDPVFGPWNELMKLPAEGFAEAARQVTQRWQSVPAGTERGQVNPLVRDALRKATLGDRGDVARAYGEVLKRVYEGSKKSAGDLPEAERAAREQLLEILTGKGGPVYFPKSQTFLYMARVPRTTYGNLLQQLDKMAVESPSAPPRAMVLVDSPDAPQPRVFLRGNPLTPGETVPRRFLKVLSGEKRAPFRDGSGRLELAEAIADPDNPLTARVLVNRVWMHHFGEPLVQSPDDFGVRTPPPTHLELLDWLAATFVEPASRYAKQGGRRAEHGGAWSIKKLHRAIVLSSTYQQGSSPQPADPENRLLGRFPRRRLELEAMRDSLLAVSGRLDPAVGGRPVDLVADPLNRRRTVYGLVDRQDVPGMYRAFDFASPDQCAGRRPRTTVPQQALFGMNSPFVVEQAKALAARAGDGTPEERVRELYRLVLQRDPTGEEIGLGVRFVRGAEEERSHGDGSKLTPWQQYAQVLLLTNEFMFVD